MLELTTSLMKTTMQAIELVGAYLKLPADKAPRPDSVGAGTPSGNGALLSRRNVFTTGAAIVTGAVLRQPDISHAIVPDPETRRLLKNMADVAKKAKENGFHDLLYKQRVSEFCRSMGEKDSVRVQVSELNDAALEMVKYAKVKLIATSSVQNWWKDEFGASYRARNLDMAQRINVTRVFLYADDEEVKALTPILKEQRAAGIHVLTAKRNSGGIPEDYVMVDDQFAGRLRLNFDRNPVEAIFYFSPDDIKSVERELTRIMSAAEVFQG